MIRQLRHVLWYELKRLISTKMAERFVVGFVRKSVSYNTYRSDSSSWILTALWVAVSTNVDISNESGMAKDILRKPRVEATEQMTQDWTFRVQESATAQKLHWVTSM